ncbi:hypothetical protein F2Q69_00043204 [Brassica cretica]|uniref:Uncharacterized protein n=1 Tax=Brassica cretica TaxID=69181 RepID=A0A8S9N903_BRACR|nr:hypothetical protein F2Q69_00043204 [Brassica cretica]
MALQIMSRFIRTRWMHGNAAFVGEDELRYGQFGRLVVVPAEASIGMHAGLLGQSDRSSCPHDIADLTLKSIDISSCDSTSDGEKLRDLDSSREVTMEEFLELEEWLDSEQKLDDEWNTKRKYLETASRATIDRHQPDEINRQLPPHHR